MSDGQQADRQQADRPETDRRDGRAAAFATAVARADATDRRGSVGTPIADQVQQTPGAIGEAVFEVLMALLRGSARRGRRAGRAVGTGLTVLVAGALLARALRNRAARNGTEGNQIVHVANPRPANTVHVEVVRTAREEVGNRELTGVIRTAIANNPDVPARVREHVAGPDGDGAVDGLLASMDVRDVDSALRLNKRQEELIDRLSEQWNSGLGFEGRFEDAWKYAVANPAVGDPDGVGLEGRPDGAWQRFAEWDPETKPTGEVLDHLNAAWLSSIASLDGEAVDARKRVEGLVARWEPQLYEASTRSLMREAAQAGLTDPDSAAVDRISAVENAALHVDEPVASADGGPVPLAEQWARLTAEPDRLRGMERGELRDLVDAWTTHGGLGDTGATALAEPALRSLVGFSERLLEANPEVGTEYLRRLQETKDPVGAFDEVSRRSGGHLFDPDSRLAAPAEPTERTGTEQAERAGTGERRGAGTGAELVLAVREGAELTPEAVRRADFADLGPVVIDGNTTLSKYPGARTPGEHRQRQERSAERRASL
ncbi:hypothetical protein [Actinorugispora endophytica]|uniref:Uncharacterized protein n=1 Tax=Actinorugispora endophytica TaxID=1605990 RepID=A0A4R6V3Y9_9ACTN|nr:hypothetical protein [Actinorugispora endophytica]TDQ55001.1 hypothetical protein EV190_101322 [Actinorugispora endophytica]